MGQEDTEKAQESRWPIQLHHEKHMLVDQRHVKYGYLMVRCSGYGRARGGPVGEGARKGKHWRCLGQPVVPASAINAPCCTPEAR